MGWIATIVGALFGSIWQRLFPPKTGADQRADDLAATTKEAEHAIKISDDIDQKPLADVESDLDKRVRDPNS